MASRIGYGNQLIQNGLVLNLDAGNPSSFDGNSTTWNDLSDNGNNGTLTNGPTYNSSNRGSMVFDGVNDYCVKTNISSNVSSATISIWCNQLTNQSGDVVPVIYGSDGFRNQCAGIYYRNSSNFVRFTTWDSDPVDYDTSFVKDFNVWHNFVIVVNDGNSVLIYRDGIPDSKGYVYENISLIRNTNKLTIGGTVANGVYCNVKVGNVSLYNRALSQSEITQNFNAIRSRYGI
jgi:Concanavalin A-like lectin/glucanases superfamily